MKFVMTGDEKVSIDIVDLLLKLGIDVEKAKANPELSELFCQSEQLLPTGSGD
jgi:hypothetical protein